MQNPDSFLGMIAESFRFLGRHILSYLWVSVLIALPIIIAGALVGFFVFAPTALGQGADVTGEVDFDTAQAEMEFELPEGMEGEFNFEGFEGLEGNPLKMTTPGGYEGGFNVTGPIFAFMGAIFIVFIIYQLYAALVLLRLTTQLKQGAYQNAADVFKWAWSHFGGYIMLTLRILAYTYAWLLILVGFGYAIVAISVSAGAFQLSGQTMNLINYAFGIAGIIAIALLIIRVPRSVFAQYAFAENGIASKEALKQSIAVSMGKWWKIVLYLLGSGLLLGLASGLLSYGLEMLHPYVSVGFDMIFQIVMSYFFLIFYLLLYKSLQRG